MKIKSILTTAMLLAAIMIAGLSTAWARRGYDSSAPESRSPPDKGRRIEPWRYI